MFQMGFKFLLYILILVIVANHLSAHKFRYFRRTLKAASQFTVISERETITCYRALRGIVFLSTSMSLICRMGN